MKILISKYQNPLVITVTLLSETNPRRVKLFEEYFILNLYLGYRDYIQAASIAPKRSGDIEAGVLLLPSSDPRDVTEKIKYSLRKTITQGNIEFFNSKETTDSPE